MSQPVDPDVLEEMEAEAWNEKMEELAEASPDGEVHCRVCSCSEHAPCDDHEGSCFWVEPGLCSACAVLEQDVPMWMQGPPFRERVLPRRVA